MKLKFVTILLTALLIAPLAHADNVDTAREAALNAVKTDSQVIDTQYYGSLRDTCKKNNVERTWNRWFGDKQKDLSVDQCCMDSIAEMEKTRGLEPEHGSCPDGSELKKLECATSKKWCEKKDAP